MKNSNSKSLEEIEAHDSIRNGIKKCFSDLNLFSESEVDEAVNLLSIQSYKKGDHVLKEGQYAAKSYSVISGCVRQYYLVDGEEKTTFFYTEGESIYSPNSTSERIPSKYFLTCVEYTTLSVLSLENQEEMYKRFPILEALSRNSLQKELVNYQEMLATYITTTPEERYLNLLKFRPELLNRVPQYQLASYLGVTPESLSRIRKRIFLK